MEKQRLWTAVEERDLKTLQKVIEQLTDVDEMKCRNIVNYRYNAGWTLLHKAASSGLLKIVKILVENGAVVNSKDGGGSTALHMAASSSPCSLEIVQYLVEKGAEINERNAYQGTPLHWAARKGLRDIVQYLVGRGAEVNGKDEEGRTALILAVCSRSLEVVQHLVENGAELNGKNGLESTALHYAVSTSSLEIIKYLVEKGAEVNGKDNWGDTALHKASDRGEDLIVEYLLQNGAVECINDIRVGQSNVFNHTPLTAACSKGHLSVVLSLIKFGVDVRKPDGQNKTPLEWSTECGYHDIKSILEGRSDKHRIKLWKLSKMPTEKITKIGLARVCFDDEFVIGQGCEGTCVYVGLLDDGSEVAVKRMLTYTCKSLFENEKRILSLLKVENSKHIVNYRHYERDNPFSCLILDLCEETLEDYVESHSKEHLEQRGPTMIREILTGLKALHCGKQKILHMDLKPSNILVDTQGHMQLADFGLSRELTEGKTTVQTGSKGTKGWMAVESNPLLSGGQVRFKRKSDIQVVGMISFFILTKGGHPFGPELFRIANIIEGKPYLEPLTDNKARNFVSCMINHNISERPYVEEALAHPYLT